MDKRLPFRTLNFLAFRTLSFLGLATVALAGCVADDGRPTVADVVAAKSEEGIMPVGAMPISDDVYAVPIAVDDNGCEQFSQWSAEGVTQPVILYRDGSGGFAATKSADYSCNAEIVDAGSDDRGCPVFRTEQPDGKVSDVVYYRAQSGYTANPERAVCQG